MFDGNLRFVLQELTLRSPSNIYSFFWKGNQFLTKNYYYADDRASSSEGKVRPHNYFLLKKLVTAFEELPSFSLIAFIQERKRDAINEEKKDAITLSRKITSCGSINLFLWAHIILFLLVGAHRD